MAPARPPGTSATHVHSSQVSSFPAALHFHTKARRGPELAESINKGVRNEDIVWKAPSSGREKAGGRIITRVTQGRGKRPWPTRKKAQGGALCGRSRAIPPRDPPWTGAPSASSGGSAGTPFSPSPVAPWVAARRPLRPLGVDRCCPTRAEVPHPSTPPEAPAGFGAGRRLHSSA